VRELQERGTNRKENFYKKFVQPRTNNRKYSNIVIYLYSEGNKIAGKQKKIERAVAEHVAEVLKAIAHPVRIAIIEVLENGDMCVGDIVEALGGKQAIISQQLNMMKDKGVLNCRRDGAKVYYRIENKNAIKLLYCIYDHCESDKLPTDTRENEK